MRCQHAVRNALTACSNSSVWQKMNFLLKRVQHMNAQQLQLFDLLAQLLNHEKVACQMYCNHHHHHHMVATLY